MPPRWPPVPRLWWWQRGREIAALRTRLVCLELDHASLVADRNRLIDAARERARRIAALLLRSAELEDELARLRLQLRLETARADDHLAQLLEHQRAEVPSLRSTGMRCRGCGGPHAFDTTVPSPAWNAVVRTAELPEYLCTACVVRLFCRAGVPLVAQLWGDDVSEATLEMVPKGQESTHAACFAAQERLLGQRAAEQARADAAEQRDRENQAALAALAESDAKIVAELQMELRACLRVRRHEPLFGR